MGYEMPHFLGRLGALMFVLVAVVAPISEAQARHWGHWKFFGYWGQGLQEGRRLRPSVEEDGANVGRAREDVRAFASPLNAAVAELMRACVEGARELQHWPNDTIAQSITPDDSQRGVLEHLRSDAGKQAEVLGAACPRDIPSDPVAQLDVSKSTAEVVLATVNTVAPLVEEFYTTLSDEQKARLIALSMRANDVNNDARPVRRSDRRRLRLQGALAKSGLCQRWERAFLDLPTQRVGREIRLSDAERGVLSVIADSTNQAADELAKSCPADVSFTPVGHLQTLRKQLEAVGQAIQTVRPVLGHFYESLNDERQQR
jgi:protein tyrosine phosphatase (PTP) superfamily phosphohydrolase (DUF442 family)